MKHLFFLVAILSSVTSISQSISGKAYYESKTTIDLSNFGGKDMPDDRKKQMAERMKSHLEKTYILTFNENESIYKEDEKLDAVTSNGHGFGMMMSSFSAGKQYKNIKTNQILEDREFFGKQFLINDTITNLQWEVSKESKMIGQYLAIKATAMKQVDSNDVKMMRPPKRNEKEAKKTGGENKEVEKDPIEGFEVPKEILVTAWFTPQIPVKNGPGDYGGLPGLILELNVDRTTILCSKIILNPNEADKIEAFKKGEEVSRKDYNKIVKKKTDEMRENFRNGGGRRGGGRRF